MEQIDVVRLQLIPDEGMSFEASLNSPAEVADAWGEKIRLNSREVLTCLYVSATNKVLAIHLVSMGVVYATLVNPAEVLKPALLCNATGIILMHNHPSGNLVPSKDDISITKRMEEACRIMGLDFLDHIIVGGMTRGMYSFRADGKLQDEQSNREIAAERKRKTR